MSLRQKMVEKFGERAVKRTVRAGELYDTADAITEAFQALKKRVDALEEAPVRYRGVWQRADNYGRGHMVTYDGSAWCAVKDVPHGEQPGKSNCWQLVVKAGRDGKDGRP